MADIELVMAGLESSARTRIGTIRLRDWQVRSVGPLPTDQHGYEGYLVRAGYDMDIAPRGPALSWFEIGFAFGDASVADVVPRTVVDPRPPSSYVLNDSLHFVPSDEPGRPEDVTVPAVWPFVDVFGVGGPEVRWRRSGGVQPGSFTAWMMVLTPAGRESLTVKVTARYDLSGRQALRFRPTARPRRFDLDLAACQGMPGVTPLARTGQRTELITSTSPRVLITYTPDSPSHVQAVLRFAEFLCECGIDTHLDRWDNDGRPDRHLWALDNITKADFVLVIASPQCRADGDGPAGELSILRDRLLDDRVTWLPRVLPVVLPGGSVDDIPLFLDPRYIEHHPITACTTSGADGLLRALTKRLRFERPMVTTAVIARRAATSPLGSGRW